MQTIVRPADVLLFQCGHCQTELSVPLALQGVTGPCPCCEWQIQAPEALPLPLCLPPLNGAHEVLTDPVPLPVWIQGPPSHSAIPPVAPVHLRTTMDDRLLPRQLSEHESLGFQARLTIPKSEEPLDDSWRERHLADHRRKESMHRLDRATEQFLDSKAWRITRTGLLLATGGLCAGLALYLQDRNWVLELPWRPDPAPTVVELSSAILPMHTRALEPADPFIPEDPADLENPGRRTLLLPDPEVVSLPVGATPIAAGQK